VGIGLLMVLLVAGLLVGDQYLAPWYPCLLVCIVLLGLGATVELHYLMSNLASPSLGLTLLSVLAVLLAGWPAHLELTGSPPHPWRDVLFVFTLVILVAFLYEMAVYREPGGSVLRIALLVWMTAYLGLLPSFLAQLRWWPRLEDATGPDLRGTLALTLTIFVPKSCDIGAYFTGQWFGRHRMTPILSPKKTWEGLLGGLFLAALVAVLLNRLIGKPLLGSDLEATAFGITLGIAGSLGDLAESLIKRDRGHKDASRLIPGFGGVLDVIDAVLFAAPVAWWWLRS
jgi:phosphatidate cytidylyltransferase